jgi:hypothetical protein
MSFLIYVKRNYRLIALVERLPDTDKENIRWMVMIETNTSFNGGAVYSSEVLTSSSNSFTDPTFISVFV